MKTLFVRKFIVSKQTKKTQNIIFIDWVVFVVRFAAKMKKKSSRQTANTLNRAQGLIIAFSNLDSCNVAFRAIENPCESNHMYNQRRSIPIINRFCIAGVNKYVRRQSEIIMFSYVSAYVCVRCEPVWAHNVFVDKCDNACIRVFSFNS